VIAHELEHAAGTTASSRRSSTASGLEGDPIQRGGFSTGCPRGATKTRSVTVAVSNLPTGDLTVLEADYVFRVSNTSSGAGKGR